VLAAAVVAGNDLNIDLGGAGEVYGEAVVSVGLVVVELVRSLDGEGGLRARDGGAEAVAGGGAARREGRAWGCERKEERRRRG
jgi:hypothetical protein